MLNPYKQLEIDARASEAEIKAAYLRKLREFPAHRDPERFKEIRAAYERIRSSSRHQRDPLTPKPVDVTIDAALIDQIEQRSVASARVTLNDLLELTF